MKSTALTNVSFLQGAFWAATGIWPILHLRSFELVTGKKRDDWLVKTIGGLIAVVGGILMASSLRKRVTPEIAALGAGSALALGAADLIFTAQGKIRPVYLADSAVEAAFLTGWALQKPWKNGRAANLPGSSEGATDVPGGWNAP